MNKPLVIQTEELHPAAAAWLGERCELAVCRWSDAALLHDLLPRTAGLLVRTYTKVDASLLARAPALRIVGRAGVGLDNIDVAACRGRGIEVVYTPDANSGAVAELVVAMMLDALRPRMSLIAAVTPERWSEIRQELIAPRPIEGLTLGVWGLGRVGSRIARVGAAMGMRVIFNDLLDIPASQRHGAMPVPREQLLESSDVLTVNVDGRASNRHLIDAKTLKQVRPNVVLINAARGFMVDAPALAEFLAAHPAACAMLDVHDPEPIDAANPLLGVKNARLFPHIGAATARAQENMSWVVRDVWRVLNGEKPEFAAPTTGG